MLPYKGSPGLATIEAGERRVQGHVAVMSELAARALSGEKPFTEPMLWDIDESPGVVPGLFSLT